MFRAGHILLPLVILTASIRISGQDQISALPDSKGVISYLNQSISWYRHFSSEEQLATEPRDVLFVNENRQLAEQIIRLSFEFANAEAKGLPADSEAQEIDQTTEPGQTRFEALQAAAARADDQVKQAQAELEGLKDQMDEAKGKQRRSLRGAVATAQGDVEIATTRRDTLRALVEFASSATGKGTHGNTLHAQIEQLERTVPVLTKSSTGEASSGKSPASSAAKQKQPNGIVGLVSELLALSRKSKSLGEALQLTSGLAESGNELLNPLAAALTQTAQRGEEISNPPGSTDPAAVKQQKAQVDALVAQAKQNAAAALPLSKQKVLLDQYQRSLTDWKKVVRDDYIADLRDLSIRLGVLAAVLILFLVFSGLWRRAIFRYVRDNRRRSQFLTIRRIVLWFMVVVTVALAFASQLGSLATFAGLLTAGVAVALQNVILSLVGYFLLIGKYGIHVGDRVQIAGVTGEVVEIGLVRLHLMEWASSESAAQPTGRVVAFPNSIVFQPTGGVFKQIPGTNYVWHEITLTLAPESDFHAVEERLLSAVESVYSEYRDRIERQRKQLEKTIGPTVGSLNPQSRLRLTKSGLEVVIRYPLELATASELDDRITRKLLDAIEQPPKLRLVGTDSPSIQQVLPSTGS
jgi:small-conductance mechanosensitive channel